MLDLLKDSLCIFAIAVAACWLLVAGGARLSKGAPMGPLPKPFLVKREKADAQTKSLL